VTVTERGGRTFDWRARFDPQSLNFRAAAGTVEMPRDGILWDTGPTIDQGREGSCVGMGCTGAVMAEPSSRQVPRPFDYATAWYRRAQRLDVWPGEAYEGTSVLAGCLVGRERKLWTGFRWAKRPAELAAGILNPELGPAVVGVQWSDELYDTDALGVMRADQLDGDLGHCLLLFGYLPEPELITDPLWDQLEELELVQAVESLDEPSFPALNSWGADYGRHGRAIAPASLVRRWFSHRGEFAMPENRTRRPRTMTETEQQREDTAVPEDSAVDELEEPGGDTTLRPTAAELREGDRITDGLPDELEQSSATVRRFRHVTGWGGEMVEVTTTAGVFTVTAGTRLTVRRPAG
jgi:hypothetical protein